MGALAIAADFLLLRGQQVFRDTGVLNQDTVVMIPIESINEPYVIKISSQVSSRTEHKVALSYMLSGPNGTQLESKTELNPYKYRNITFNPSEPGNYMLNMSPNYDTNIVRNITDSNKLRYSVTVLVNDRRVLGPIFELFKF